MKQTARRTFPPNMKAPAPRGSSYSDSYSHESCPTSSCDSCFGYIYDNGYDSNTEELNDEDDEDDEDGLAGLDGWDQSSACQSQITDPFSMSSMSSLFGSSSSSSSSSQEPQSTWRGVVASPVPPSSRGKGPRSAQRCSCQKTSKGFCNSFPGPPSGNNGQNQNQNTATETQLSVFSNSNGPNGQTGTNNQTQTQTQTDSQALGHLLGGGLGGANTKGKNGNGNGMIKNLNVYNPNITIQVTPENFIKFNKFFSQKSGNGNGNKGAHS